VKWIVLGLAILFMAGCTTHYYKSQNNLVNIYLKKKAKRIYFVSSLDQYKPHPIQKKENGDWVIAVSGSEAFRYFYLVDGEVYIPDCRFKEFDDFGKQNCIFVPTRPDDMSSSKSISK
jgi:hypothetical protein